MCWSLCKNLKILNILMKKTIKKRIKKIIIIKRLIRKKKMVKIKKIEAG